MSIISSRNLQYGFLASAFLVCEPRAAFAFDDKDCGRIESVDQSYSLDLKSNDSVEDARAKAIAEIVKQAIAQVVGYEIHSAREQNTQVLNNDAQERYQDAEKALLDGMARVRVLDEKRSALPSGQTLSVTAQVKVCVPKPEAVRKADKTREERLTHPPKSIDPSRAVWFNPVSGEPQVWFSKGDDGSYSFFDNVGFDPVSGEPLRPITGKTIKEWKASLTRQRQFELAEAAKAKEEAEKALIAKERDRIEAERRADLLLHARENCDKFAANPNDPAKPSNVVGATYDELKASNIEAVQSCEAAVKAEPGDRRLQYQLARAYSVEDPRRAASIFKSLCDQRYIAAYDNYGWIFLSRRAGTPDLSAAIGWFRRGVQMGNSDAMVSLATYIQKGKVVGASLNDAIALYQRAASLGNQDASKALEPIIAAQKQAEFEHQQAEIKQRQDIQNAQAIMGLFGAAMGGMRR